MLHHSMLRLTGGRGADWRQSSNQAGNPSTASPGDQAEMAALQMAPHTAALWSGDIQAPALWDESVARAAYARYRLRRPVDAPSSRLHTWHAAQQVAMLTVTGPVARSCS